MTLLVCLCFIRMEGKLFADVPMNLELRLSVEDSPNSAGVVIDAIRCCKLDNLPTRKPTGSEEFIARGQEDSPSKIVSSHALSSGRP